MIRLDVPNMPTITLYRALYGAWDPESSLFTGVSDEQLREFGITFDNNSDIQHRLRTSGKYMYGLGLYGLRRVSGLPVFINQDRAVATWLSYKSYRQPPAVAKVSIPVQYFYGRTHILQLRENLPDKWTEDRVYSTRDIIETASRQQHGYAGSGEHYLVYYDPFGNQNSIPSELIRQHEEFYRPEGFSSGHLECDSLHQFTLYTPEEESVIRSVHKERG